MDAITPFLFPAILVAAFYFLIIRPARTRSRAAQQLQDRLAPGLEVMTTSGIYATVASIEDDAVVLEVSPGVRMRFAKAAVTRILSTDETTEDEDDAGGSSSDVTTDDRPESDQTSR